MNVLVIIISVIFGAIVIIAVLWLFKKPVIDQLIYLMEQKSREVIKNEREQINEQFQEKKDYIKELIERIHNELTKSHQKIEATEKERIGEFSALKTVFEEYKIITGGLKESTDHLKNILSNNQLRGKYGEQIAEDLMKSIGFVKGQNYTANIAQDTTSTRPDFTILLPDGSKVNIDAKFPLKSLIKFQEAKDKLEQERHLREFASDIKQKIKEVTSRDYINPEEKTLDFVILFVPNEMIFSFIYDHFNDVWDDAMKKRVIMTGPFSFVAILRMIAQTYQNFKYQKNLYEIIGLIRTFEKEFTLYNQEVDKLGDKIDSVSGQFNKVSNTRTKKLTRIVEKIKDENILPETEEIKLLEEKEE